MRTLAVVTLLLLAVPWGWAISPALIVAPVFPVAYVAWWYWRENTTAVLLAALAACVPERVIPPDVLEAPAPTEDEFRRGYALRAVQGRGALTDSGIAEHCRFAGGVKRVRPHVDALVAQGLVERVEVEDGGPPVVVEAGAELDGAPAAPAA